jgi:hypothetical protein
MSIELEKRETYPELFYVLFLFYILFFFLNGQAPKAKVIFQFG